MNEIGLNHNTSSHPTVFGNTHHPSSADSAFITNLLSRDKKNSTFGCTYVVPT